MRKDISLAQEAFHTPFVHLVAISGGGPFLAFQKCFGLFEVIDRNVFVTGREEIVKFLTEKWEKELDYKLKKEYWAHTDNRIAVRFEYEYRNKDGQWFRAYGNENWEFDENGLMAKRYASINDLEIDEADRHV